MGIIIKKSMYYLMKYRYFLLILFFLFLTYLTFFKLENILDKNSNYKFETIEDLKKYANFYLEDYKIENNDWADPSFVNLYKNTLRHSDINKILVKLGIKNDPIWNLQEFELLLEKLTRDRLEKKLKSPFDQKIELKENARCIIFGDLHGAFHSLVRDLLELEKQKIIDNNLNIISQDTYIIILGDAINRAPYSLEVLNILLLLIEKNQEKIFYLKGNHETNGYWRNFNMKRQIQTLFPQLSKPNKKNNLFNKIDKFFNTLPNSLIININGPKKDSIICSNSEKPKLFENNKNIKFMIIGEKRSDMLKETLGLEFIGYENGIAKWSIISCPTVIYKKYFNFHYDAFLELTIGQTAQNSILTLNNHDTRNKNSDYKQTFYEPIFGKQLKNKYEIINKNIYSTGSTMDTSGIISNLSKEIKSGLETAIYFNNENNKNLLKLVLFDDQYAPKTAKINVEKLLNQYNIKSIISPTGTPTLSFYLDMIKTSSTYVFFPYTGVEQFRDKAIKNIIHFRASYKDEAKNTINYLVKECGIKNFAFFYENDSYGLPIVETAHEELKKLGITTWLDLPHLKTQAEFTDIIRKLRSSGPDAIALFSGPFATQEFIEQLGPEFFSERTLFGVSLLFSDYFCRFLNNRGIEYLLTSIVPDPITSELEIVKEFRNNMKKRGLNINSNSLEGYINASLITDAISKIDLPITEDKIMQYFENIKNYNFKGLNLSFNPEKRDLSQPLWIKTNENKWINYKL